MPSESEARERAWPESATAEVLFRVRQPCIPTHTMPPRRGRPALVFENEDDRRRHKLDLQKKRQLTYYKKQVLNCVAVQLLDC